MKRRTKLKRKAAAAGMLAAPLALSLFAPAGAQDLTAHRGFVKGGVNYLTNSNARDHTRSLGYSLGAGMGLQSKTLLAPDAGLSSLDVHFNRNSDSGNKISTWGVTYSERYPTSRNTRNVFYVGWGIGIFHSSARVTDMVANGSIPNGSYPETVGAPVLASIAPGTPGSETRSDGRTQLGGVLMAGVNLSETTFVEAQYNIVGKMAGVQPQSINLSLGVRF